MKRIGIFMMSCLFLLVTMSAAAQKNQPQLQTTRPAPDRTTALLADEIRHQVLTLPYYGMFDWIEAQILPDGSVTLSGEVVRDSTKMDAESRVRKLEGVTKVVNQIELLPASQNDDQIRRETYRAIFKSDSSLFEYATRAASPLHIIVKDGHVALKGLVNTAMDKQLAYMAAAAVPGVFDVKNELTVEK